MVLSNLGKITTQGVDITFNYSRDLHFAKLGLSFLGNYTDYNRFQNAPGALDRNCVGYYSVNCGFSGSIQPRFQWSQRTTLSFDSLDVSLLWRHIDKMRQEPDDIVNGNGPAFSGVSPITGQTVNYGYIKPFDYFDLSGPCEHRRKPVADADRAEYRQPQAADRRKHHRLDRVQQRQHFPIDV